MLLKTSLPLVLLALLSFPTGLHAAPVSLEQEYQQVRRIALRDPKVRAAYEDADRRLQEKIIRIDPALSTYVEHRGSGAEPAPAAAKVTTSHATTVHVAPAHAAGKTHVIAQGETLTSIAAHYGVTVPALKAANHNPDETHLRIGQTLVIP